jgi:hypothetical protein
LTESAWGATRKKEGYFKYKYQKLIVRKGSKKAIVAVAHKLIIAAYQVLKKKEAYRSPLLDSTKYNEKQRQKEVQKTIMKLSKLGFTVRITPVA